MGGVGSANRRLSTITLDQIISGGSNVLTSVFAAHVLTIGGFGLFSVVFLIYVTAQGVARALVSGPVLIHPDQAEHRPGDAIGAALLVGVVLGALAVAYGVLGLLLHLDAAGAMIILGVCLPLLGLQDLGRYLGFATQRPWFAVFIDTLWLLLVAGGLVWIVTSHHRTLNWFVVIWAATGAVSGLPVLMRSGVMQAWRPWAWLKEVWPFSWRYLASFVTTQVSTLGASIGFGAIAGVSTLGGVRAAQLLQRPIQALQSAGLSAGIAEVTRVQPPVRSEINEHIRRITKLVVIAALLNLIVLFVLPDRLGTLALGNSWLGAKDLLLPLNIQILLLALATGVQAGLTGLKFVRLTLKIDVATLIVVIIPPLVGAAIGGALAACWALAIGQGVVTVVWWVAYLRCDVTAEPLKRRGRHSDRQPITPQPVVEVLFRRSSASTPRTHQ